MYKHKYTLLLLCSIIFLLTFTPILTAAASIPPSNVIKGIFYIGSEKSEYPIIRTDNSDVNYKINRDIQNYIADMRAAVDSTKNPTTSIMQYKIYYETNTIISIVFKEYRYYYHAAHGMYFIHGIVYNKSTGAKIPITHYLNMTPDDLQNAINNHTAKVFGGNGNTPIKCNDIYKIKYISKNYSLLKKDGRLYISLIYPPYELAPYVVGIVRINIPL
ncbi:DUF3298 domain-containing protein [Pectinatus sottacetonis]|uniref:DUF3298 domain-containing protein n=1 Tax=Pectinatus sottacetonis TaxID=1002795 RepID=UPI0018C5A31C|nr:DUF4163 domain-containing protein [Pectinatus sottacetonis]